MHNVNKGQGAGNKLSILWVAQDTQRSADTKCSGIPGFSVSLTHRTFGPHVVGEMILYVVK